MNGEDLAVAASSVRKYLRTRDLSLNTVLAAHMRSQGIPPNGVRWELAKAAMRAGKSFEDAARLAAEFAGEDADAPRVASPRSISRGVARSAPRVDIAQPQLTVATELTPARRSQEPMDWYPQRFEPGAIQGDGAKKLLGSPKVSLEDMLVRETAQNSWDARAGDRPVAFTMNLRQLDAASVRDLRENVFTGEGPGTHIHEALADESLWIIEISDRGTIGLGGPVRNDLTPPPGAVTHFINLVFNIGATKSDKSSGGTYGFGKSIAYMVSEVGAVVIWSRCNTDSGPEDRLIASAIGDVFDREGFRYTGRHWWGRTVEGRPEPLVGQAAATLGNRLFSKGFDGDELGTSLLILAPLLGEPGPDDDAEVLAQSVLWNLWPKLIPGADGERAMDIRVQVNGVDHSIPDPATHPALSGHVACLRAVRAAQAGSEPPASLFRTEVIELSRYNAPIGHLALTKYPVPRTPVRIDETRFPSHSVTLMRSSAELVVRELDRPALADPGFQWAGVFKPLADHDSIFAESEPPAHDDWAPESLTNKIHKSIVKVALDKIRQEADHFLAPSAQARVASGNSSTAAVGDMLAGFLGGIAGSAPSPKAKAGGAGGARSAKAAIAVRRAEGGPADRAGWTRTVLEVSVRGGLPSGTPVAVRVRVATDGGTERSEQPDYVREIGWVGAEEGAEAAIIKPETPRLYVFESRDDIAVDVNSGIAAEDADIERSGGTS
ncbi:hypothetical protein [Nocardioides jejuensis]|uniref:Uncharacterized protein n=1 Tax=Nocardioides jejuensis TaxID=2502782 RepID=A0A4R1CKA2_9ACTN|nr:hypothetical protein [Nocardioides jejuensis]TCJ30428.1 hypothetical protein EPD65_04310 [Nocardioides jejuensis]